MMDKHSDKTQILMKRKKWKKFKVGVLVTAEATVGIIEKIETEVIIPMRVEETVVVTGVVVGEIIIVMMKEGRNVIITIMKIREEDKIVIMTTIGRVVAIVDSMINHHLHLRDTTEREMMIDIGINRKIEPVDGPCLFVIR